MNLELTTLAVREKLMDYFKGDCVNKMIGRTQVQMVNEHDRVRYLYQRREQEISGKSGIYLKDTRILILSLNPGIVTFSSNIYRSKQLRELKDNIDNFLKEYLKGIQVVYPNNQQDTGRNDSSLLEGSKLYDPKDSVSINSMYRDLAREQMVRIMDNPYTFGNGLEFF